MPSGLGRKKWRGGVGWGAKIFPLSSGEYGVLVFFIRLRTILPLLKSEICIFELEINREKMKILSC